MDSSKRCARQQGSNPVSLDVQDLVLKLQALIKRRRARRNTFRRPRGISYHRPRQRRQPTEYPKPTRCHDTHTSSHTSTKPTLPTNKGDAQFHNDATRFFGIEEILAKISYVEVDEIDLTQCDGSEGIQEAIDSAEPVYMTLHEMRYEQGTDEEQREEISKHS